MWAKFDDQFYLNKKNACIDRDEQDLFMAGVIYCSGQLTDGFIPSEKLMQLYIWAKLPLEANPQANAQAIARRLIEHNYWELVDGGYTVHDYLDWNMSKAEVLALKEARSAAGKRGGSKSASKRQASAQAKLKQNATLSLSLNQSPKNDDDDAAQSKTFASAVIVGTTNWGAPPSRELDEALGTIRTLRAQYPEKAQLINYLKPFWKEFVRRYPGTTSYTWLKDWAAAGTIPQLPPEMKKQEAARRKAKGGNDDPNRFITGALAEFIEH